MPHPPLHRAFRRLSLPPASIGWSIALATIPELLLLFFAERILHAHGALVIGLLRWIGIPTIERTGLAGAVAILVPSVTAFPSAQTLYAGLIAIITALWFLAGILPLSRLSPGRVIFALTSFVTSVSAAYFYFAGERFPYSTHDFAELWTRAEFVVWLVIPLLFAVTLGPLPLRPAMPMLYAASTVLYAMWFSVVRLTLLMTLFHFGGLIWAAPAYFICGFLLDFVFIVGFYSIAIGRTARNLRRAQEVWSW